MTLREIINEELIYEEEKFEKKLEKIKLICKKNFKDYEVIDNKLSSEQKLSDISSIIDNFETSKRKLIVINWRIRENSNSKKDVKIYKIDPGKKQEALIKGQKSTPDAALTLRKLIDMFGSEEEKNNNEKNIRKNIKTLGDLLDNSNKINEILKNVKPTNKINEIEEVYKLKNNDKFEVIKTENLSENNSNKFYYLKNNDNYYFLGTINNAINKINSGNWNNNKRKKEEQTNELNEKQTKKQGQNNGNDVRSVNSAEQLKNAENNYDIKNYLKIITLPCGMVYVDNKKYNYTKNGRSENKNKIASNGIDQYIITPNSIKIGVELKAHETTENVNIDTITPILKLIFNNGNNSNDKNLTVGLIDGKAIKELEHGNLVYNKDYTYFYGDGHFENIRQESGFKKQWSQYIDGNKYKLKNISPEKLGANIKSKMPIYPILSHEQYFVRIVDPLISQYNTIMIKINGAKETYNNVSKYYINNTNTEDTNVKNSVDTMSCSVEIKNNINLQLDKLKKICKEIDSIFNTTMGVPRIKQIDKIIASA